MYINFTFADGSNPYICTNNKKLWDMINRYCVDQTGEKSFCVLGRGEIWTVRKRLSAYYDQDGEKMIVSDSPCLF